MSAPDITLQGIPELETERLRLRAPAPKDWPSYKALMVSERAQHVGGPYRPHRAYLEFSCEISHWLIRGIGPWMICLKGCDESLGLVGPYFPEGWPEREIGWLLWHGAEGQGYASEAAIAARHYVYTVAGWDTAVSYIGPENHRSIAVAERVGAVLDPEAQTLDPGDLVYRHPSPEALGLRGGA